jgi:ArsR family transcriptional regulator
MDREAERLRGRGSEERSQSMLAEVRGATAERLRILGKEKAIALVEALATEGEASVQELADRLGVSHQNASHHLSLLRQAGVVRRRTEGPTSIYALEDWAAWWVIRQLAELAAEDGA